MPELADSNQIPQQRNVEVVRRFIEGGVNGGDLEVIDQTWSDNMSWHGGSLGTYHGRDAFKQHDQPPAAGVSC